MDFIQLDAPRTVSFKAGKNAFTYTFRRITDADWRQYFAGISFITERAGAGRTNRLDVRSSGLDLVEHCLEKVEGYPMRDGSNIMDLADWKQRLPYGHRLKAAELLVDVSLSDVDREYFFEPDIDEVVLDAAWNSAAPGLMTRCFGLVHRFHPATAEHQRRFNRATSESRVVGGSRAGRTIYPGSQALLIALYDELVVSVDGYGVQGKPLTGADAIKHEMDTFHKVSAVQQLFATPDDDAEPAEANEAA
jgi:hypothetical protein